MAARRRNAADGGTTHDARDRAMIGNTATTWGLASRLLHWAGAGFIVVLVAHGGWMTQFAPRAARFEHYAWHASVGYALIVLMILRLFWRLGNAVPALPGMSAAERVAALGNHWLLYALSLGASFTGWALAGTFRRPLDTTLFGLVRVPPIVASQDQALHQPLESWHGILSWALAALVVVHVCAAFWHLALRKDGIMQRMLTAPPRP